MSKSQRVIVKYCTLHLKRSAIDEVISKVIEVVLYNRPYSCYLVLQ